MREDARQNRQRILDTAREVFTRRGLDVPMATIARRAGVGVATLYRHFPNRQALITEVADQQLTECVSVVDEALADPDPWRAFRTAVERLAAMQAVGHELTSAFAAALPGAFDLGVERHEAERKLTELVWRAKVTGQLRPDFRVEDLVLVLKAVSGVATNRPRRRPDRDDSSRTCFSPSKPTRTGRCRRTSDSPDIQAPDLDDHGLPVPGASLLLINQRDEHLPI